jgi:hypothetical protein
MAMNATEEKRDTACSMATSGRGSMQVPSRTTPPNQTAAAEKCSTPTTAPTTGSGPAAACPLSAGVTTSAATTTPTATQALVRIHPASHLAQARRTATSSSSQLPGWRRQPGNGDKACSAKQHQQAGGDDEAVDRH